MIAFLLKLALGARSVLRWIADHPVPALLALSLGLNAWLLLVTGPGLRADLAEARAATVAEANAHRQTKDNYRRAQMEALAIHRQAKAAYEADLARIAKEADHATELAQRDAADALAAYIARTRLRPPTGTGAGSASGSAPAAAENRLAESGDGPGGPAELAGTIAVSEEDLRRCTVNTVRLVQVREWALGLNLPIAD